MKKILLCVTIFGALQVAAQLGNSVPSSGPVGIGTISPSPGNQLTVNGGAKFLNSALIEGSLIVVGQVVMKSIVRMPEIETYSGGIFDDMLVMIIDSMGNVQRSEYRDLVRGIMHPPAAELAYCDSLVTVNPQWFHGPYKIFAPCPDVKVGIGTSNPTHQLTVPVGITYLKKILAGNSTGSTDAVLNAFAINHSQKLIELGKKIGALDE